MSFCAVVGYCFPGSLLNLKTALELMIEMFPDTCLPARVHAAMHCCCESLDIVNGLVKDGDTVTKLSLVDSQTSMAAWRSVHDDLVAMFSNEQTVAAIAKFKDYFFDVVQQGFNAKAEEVCLALVAQLQACLNTADGTSACWSETHADELMRLSTAEVFATDAESMKRTADAADAFVKLAGSGLNYKTSKDGMKLSSKPNAECQAALTHLKNVKLAIDHINKTTLAKFVDYLMELKICDDQRSALQDTTERIMSMYGPWDLPVVVRPALQSTSYVCFHELKTTTSCGFQGVFLTKIKIDLSRHMV